MKILIIILLTALVGLDFLARAAGVRLMFPWQLKSILRTRPDALQLLDIRRRLEY
ncbi:MAG: hypothetical protein JJV98_21340 [Desulfosarcina sp.]|nr:hypothetical protein [Desulfobacterales bacterium]